MERARARRRRILAAALGIAAAGLVLVVAWTARSRHAGRATRPASRPALAARSSAPARAEPELAREAPVEPPPSPAGAQASPSDAPQARVAQAARAIPVELSVVDAETHLPDAFREVRVVPDFRLRGLEHVLEGDRRDLGSLLDTLQRCGDGAQADRVRTDGGGRASLSLLPGRYHFLGVEDGILVGEPMLEVSSDDVSHEVVLDRRQGVAVCGRVLDPAGAPVAGAVVVTWFGRGFFGGGDELLPDCFALNGYRVGRTAADGSYRLCAIAPGVKLEVEALLQRTGAAGTTGGVEIDAGLQILPDLHLVPPGRVRVIVRTPEGKPRRGVRVAVRPEDDQPFEARRAIGVTGASGMLEARLAAGGYTLVAELGQDALGEVHAEVEADRDLEVVLSTD